MGHGASGLGGRGEKEAQLTADTTVITTVTSKKQSIDPPFGRGS